MQAGSLLQIGTAAGLWQRPATEAIARFTHAFGPWPARVQAGLLHAPWGTSPLPSTAAATLEGYAHVYLRESAVSFGRDLAHSLPVQAHTLGALPTGQGVEMRCALHGVTVRLRAAAALPAGDSVLVHVDPSQALVYPHNQMECLAA
jgi:ABC-type sugar transport system ATPase subunit